MNENTDLPIFRLNLINERTEPVNLMTFAGELLARIPAEENQFLEMDSRAEYARFSEIIWRKDGTVISRENPKYEDPYKGFVLELENLTKKPKVVRVDGMFHRVDPGIPRTIPIRVDDELIFVKSMKWAIEKVKVPISQNSDYVVETEKETKTITPRGIRESQKIKALLRQTEGDKAAKKIARLAPKTEEGEED